METKKSGLWVAAVAASVVAVAITLLRTKDAEPAPEPASATPATTNSQPKTSTPGTPADPAAGAAPEPGITASAPASLPPGNSPNPAGGMPPRPPAHDPDGPPPPPPPPEIPKTRELAREVVDRVQFTIRDYRAALKENPVGNNAEITRALLGDNLKQMKFSLPEGSQLNGQGELCDPWGTPYFFHALARDKMEIRSAGPDRTLWTSDDINQ